MWQEIVDSPFLKWLVQGFTDFITTLVMLMVVGVIGFILGELFPRRFVNYNHFPFNDFKWEDGGKFYLKLKINAWKDKVPDMSTFIKGMFYKKNIGQTRSAMYFERFIKETCVAEVVHVGLMFAGFIVFYNYHGYMGLFSSVLFAVGNVPFILIQRYNRPRFKQIMQRQLQLEARQRTKQAEDDEPDDSY